MDSTQFTKLKLELARVIDSSQDSLRFYQIGTNYKTKVEHVGTKAPLDLEEPLIF